MGEQDCLWSALLCKTADPLDSKGGATLDLVEGRISGFNPSYCVRDENSIIYVVYQQQNQPHYCVSENMSESVKLII